MKLTEREEEILYQLPNDWCRPMDIGGRDGSDHSAVLKRLAERDTPNGVDAIH
jgi:hypothetical protein